MNPEKTFTTESVNPRTGGISQADTAEILRLINYEDSLVPAVVAGVIPAVAKLTDCAVECVKNGGRIVYCGCGTSGRLAVADAAECPPTYGLSPELISAVIAGGAGAILNASEGCEDSAEQGKKAFRQKNLGKNDLVIGISAAGRAPFVLAFLEEAKKSGCAVGAIVNNTGTPLEEVADIAVVACTGPEAIKGSTRMKAGTAQKLILNMFSTAVCIKIGCTYQNYMVNMQVSNSKLRRRAVAMVTEIAGVGEAAAEAALQKHNWSVRETLAALIK